MTRNRELFYKNVYRNTESEQWTRIAQKAKTNQLVIVGYVEKLKDIAARSLKRGYIEKDDIGKIAYQNISLKKANFIFSLLLEEEFLVATERDDLFYIKHWHLYQDDITNYQSDFVETPMSKLIINETALERKKRLTRERVTKYRNKNATCNADVTQCNDTVTQRNADVTQNNVTNGGYKGEENKKIRKQEIQKSLKKQTKKDLTILPETIPPFIDLKVWSSWLDHRKAMRKPLTPQAAKIQLENLAAWRDEGFDVSEIINTTIGRNWQGLEYGYNEVKKRKTQNIISNQSTNFSKGYEKNNGSGASPVIYFGEDANNFGRVSIDDFNIEKYMLERS